MKELFSLLLLVAESNSSVVSAPEIIDTSALERWLTGSVWGLLGLNLLALILFVLSISSPQVTKLKTLIQSWMAERARLKAEAMAAKEAAAKEAAAKEEAAKLAAASAPAVTEQATKATPEATAQSAPIEAPPPPPAETDSAQTPTSESSTTTPVDASPAPESLQEETEELEASSQEASSQEQTQPAPTSEIPPPPQPLPEPKVSGEKKEAGDTMTFESKQDFEKALNEFLSSPSEQTEELPIFDTKALDESLQWTPESATKDRTKEDPS